MSYVGVSCGVELIEHFIEHYHRLGVDRFLLVLHSMPDDPRLPAVQDILSRFNAEPTEMTSEFSTPRKILRFNAMIDEHCHENDWLIYADTDEFHVYPKPLHEMIDECNEHGFEFIRGTLLDRLGENGELLPHPSAGGKSMFEQYPCSANITDDIRYGWVGKVCAARATRRLGEGGMHTVYYGPDELQLNYDRTIADTAGHPHTIEVAHFRWDQAVTERLKNKFKGAGGDREFLDDPSFKLEYERIWEHIKRFGRINADDATYVGVPDLHYVRD